MPLTVTFSMCPYRDTWVISQKASAALKYMSGVGAEPAEVRALIARERLVCGTVVAHGRQLQEWGDRRDVGLEHDLAALDGRVETLGQRCHGSSSEVGRGHENTTR